MRKAFLDFLAAEGVVPPDRLENLQNLLRGAPEPIGCIAFSYGMVVGGDVDQILDEQRRTYRPFGEIAMRLGMLSRTQIDALLKVQSIRGAIETVEALTLSDLCPIDELMAQLGRFLLRQAENLPCESR
ncbi:MAG: hypothetical protein ABII12_08630 [Planctomycetota bacterium]